ncbi:MAG: hypothetical protein HY986_12985 [Candidatus Melainabacteria bacterium]|nr:hypothetical protein [Candidatus Melainabacteria bacterium]
MNGNRNFRNKPLSNCLSAIVTFALCAPSVAGNESSETKIEQHADSPLSVIDEARQSAKRKRNSTPLFTFEELLANPVKADGKKVRVEGFFTYWATCNGGDMFIFPDKETLQLERPIDGLQIRLSPKFAFGKEYVKGLPVEVTGVFREGHRLTGIITTTPKGYIDNAFLRTAR